MLVCGIGIFTETPKRKFWKRFFSSLPTRIIFSRLWKWVDKVKIIDSIEVGGYDIIENPVNTKTGKIKIPKDIWFPSPDNIEMPDLSTVVDFAKGISEVGDKIDIDSQIKYIEQSSIFLKLPIHDAIINSLNELKKIKNGE